MTRCVLLCLPFLLTCSLRAENLLQNGGFEERDGHAYLYGHILYVGQPYDSATHFFAKIPPGTYDGKRISVTGAADRKWLDAVRAVSTKAWAAHVALQRKVGCDGIIIYRMGGLDPATAAFFGNGPFHKKTRFPESLKPKTVATPTP